MTATTIGTLALAAVAILGCIGSVLMLAYRVGRLTGGVEARMLTGEQDRTKLWEQFGAIMAKLDRHIEGHQHRDRN